MVLLNPAEDWSKLSTSSHYVFRPCQGHQMYGWKDQGYKTIIDVMMVSRFYFCYINNPDYVFKLSFKNNKHYFLIIRIHNKQFLPSLFLEKKSFRRQSHSE